MNRTKQKQLPSYRLLLVVFGILAAYFTVAFFYWTLVPFLQTIAYEREVRNDRIHNIHMSHFIFVPYTYAQRVIRQEYLKYLIAKDIDKTSMIFFDGAIAKMEELVAFEGTNPYQYFWLGRAFEKKVRVLKDRSYLFKAEEYFKKSMELAPQRQEPLYTYGHFLMRQNRFEEAVKIFGSQPALGHGVSISYFYLGQAQFNLGNAFYLESFKNLEFFFNQPVQENPDQGILRGIYAQLLYYFYQQGDAARFMMTAERLTKIDPNKQPLYAQMVQKIRNNGNLLPALLFQEGKFISIP